MTASAHPLDDKALRYVCEHLRGKAVQEARANGWDGNAESLFRLLQPLIGNGISWFGALDHPVYAGGAVEVHPGAWMFWTVATEEFSKAVTFVTKYVRRVVIPELRRRGAWRIEARCIGGDVEVQKWMGLLGAKLESTQKGVGKNGEDFLIYTWSFKDVRR